MGNQDIYGNARFSEGETENRYCKTKSVPVEVFEGRPMEVLREFLESSTIHGLSYISTAKVSQPITTQAACMIYYIKYMTLIYTRSKNPSFVWMVD